MVNSGQSIQFFCSKCNTFLKESAFLNMPGASEECPACGHQLSETLHVQRPAKPRQSLTLQTAYEMGATLTLGMEEIDSFLDLRLGDRLCVRALLPQVDAVFEKYAMLLKTGKVPLDELVFTKHVSKDTDEHQDRDTVENSALNQLARAGKLLKGGQTLRYVVTGYRRKGRKAGQKNF